MDTKAQKDYQSYSREQLLALVEKQSDQITALLKKTDAQQKQLAQVIDQNSELLDTMKALGLQVEKFQRMLFGQRSERKKRTSKKKPPDGASSGQSGKENKRNGRRSLPDTLPRTVIKHDLPDDEKICPSCQVPLHCIGKDVSEQLEYIRAHLMVIEHRRYKYTCRLCKKLFMAELPAQPIDKGLPGPSLLAQTVIDKYDDHLPLYRCEKRYERLGYSIPRSTLCDWVKHSAVALSPIVELMREEMLAYSPKLHTDDTIIPVQAKEKVRKGRLWVYIGGGGHAPPTVIYQYSPTRRGEVPQAFLKNYFGYVQADAYPGYDKCFKDKRRIEVACWSHARRKFVEAEDDSATVELVLRFLALIGKLYAIERVAKNMSDIQRYYYRKRYDKYWLKKIYRLAKQKKTTVTPKSPLGEAIGYLLNHWKAFNNYLKASFLSIDNNCAERAMKTVVIGRKNYLFAGSDDGARSAAILYSIIATCKALNINTFDYLTDVFKRLPTTLNKDLKSLLPHYWKPAK